MFPHNFVFLLWPTLCLPRESIGTEEFISNKMILKCTTRTKGFYVHPKNKHNTHTTISTPPQDCRLLRAPDEVVIPPAPLHQVMHHLLGLFVPGHGHCIIHVGLRR